MHLLFTINQSYLFALKTCIHSICRFESKDGYDISILHDDLSTTEIQAFLDSFSTYAGLSFHFISVPKETFAAFPQSNRYPKTMYFRLMAHKLLPETVDRVLYLDPDIIVIRPLDQLYQLPFRASTLCYAATHVKGTLEELNCLRLSVPDGTPYINTGVLLLDLKALRAKDRTEEMLRFIEEKQAVFTLPDQDIFTALYGQQTQLLDTMVYNLSDRILTIYNANLINPRRGLHWVRENTVIIHYCGRNKPWKKPYLGVLNVFYEELLQSLPASVQKTLSP